MPTHANTDALSQTVASSGNVAPATTFFRRRNLSRSFMAPILRFFAAADSLHSRTHDPGDASRSGLRFFRKTRTAE
jgi:hypothetical protein